MGQHQKVTHASLTGVPLFKAATRWTSKRECELWLKNTEFMKSHNSTMVCRKRKVNLKCSRESLEEKEKTLWHPHRSGRRPQKNLKLHGDAGQIPTGPVGNAHSPSASPSFSPPYPGYHNRQNLMLWKMSVRENIKVLLKEREGYIFPMEHCECLGMYLITLPHAPLTHPLQVAFSHLLTWDSTISPISSPYHN